MGSWSSGKVFYKNFKENLTTNAMLKVNEVFAQNNPQIFFRNHTKW